MSVHYDDLPLNEDILLDLPFREATGIITQDIAKPHHPVDLIDTPTWVGEASGMGVLEFNGASEYLESDVLDTLDLDFTNGDYSLSAWVKWTDTTQSEIVIGRYEVNDSGWELYLTRTGGVNYLTIRHHHAAAATTRTAGYSVGWTPGGWTHIGLSRSGIAAPMYRNGVAVDMTYSAGGLIDPEVCGQDLVLGTRYTKDANWYEGRMWRPRVWGRALTASEWLTIYEIEKGWFP